MTVYLVHYEQPISQNHTTQHYIGFANKVAARLDYHKNKPDARLMQVAKERGIGFALARVWEGGRDLERKLKNRKAAPRMCPICQGQKDYEAW